MTPLLDVRGLVKEFAARATLFGRRPPVRAVDEVSFTIAEGETFGLVGESGSGKTTTGRCVLRLVEPTAGEIVFKGADVRRPESQPSSDARAATFRSCFRTRTPRSTRACASARSSRSRSSSIALGQTQANGRRRSGRSSSWSDSTVSGRAKYPHEFSGGQRQRIGLARALALEPSLVVADEPVSALDVSVQAQVVNLLLDLQERLGLTYLFIAHDLRLVRQVCSRVAVMYRGRIVELAAAQQLFDEPAHPYTRALLSAIPQLEPGREDHACAVRRRSFERLPLREVGSGHFAAV